MSKDKEDKINFQKIEKKWQDKWRESGIFKTSFKKDDKKFYVLEMYPYPSGYGMHMGHARNYSIGDCLARFKRMCGFQVLYPMGWDSFGLPSENAAIKKGVHPTVSIKENIKTMKKQMNSLGISYDWSREITTHIPNYYKWDQWLFLKMFKEGLAYKKKARGNWCPNCETTLANEDVKNGKCWRCDTEVIQKNIEQWFFKITDYADELLEGLEKLDWPKKLKTLQKNWIGKSKGVTINFESEEGVELPVYTTRPDTLFGVTFLVLAPEHPKVLKMVKGTEYEEKVKKFLKKTRKLQEVERLSKEKEGLFVGKYAINPINGEKIPIYIANFVLMNYGTGTVMCVPAHDQRDFEFAKKYNIPIKVVIKPENKDLKPENMKKAYVDQGLLVNSGDFSGMDNKKAIEKISDYLEKENIGKREVNYKIRDWCISRQRYWGAPIPIVYCDKCGIVPVPEEDLPVKLPIDVDFSKKGAPPLATNKKFVNTKCPECGGKAKRETDTMTTFVDSSWYFLRYCSPNENNKMFDKEKANYWMPIDQYIGGIEHAVGHLLYSRFVTKFLKREGYLNLNEPFKSMLNQGMVKLGGIKMSKSRGNVVDPIEIIEKYCADTLRTYLLFVAKPDTAIEWSEKDLFGIHKFLKKILSMNELEEDVKKKSYIESITQRKIERVTHYMKKMEFNKALIELMDFSNKIEKYPSKYSIEMFVKMMTPFSPHVCEELWEKLGHESFVSNQKWPEIDEEKINKKAELGHGLIKTILEDIKEIKKITGIEEPEKIKLFLAPEWKYDVYGGVKEGKETKDFMKKEKYKKLGKKLVKYVSSLKETREKILKRKKEIKILKKEKEFLNKKTNANIEIIEESKEDKAKQAGPMKPGILIE